MKAALSSKAEQAPPRRGPRARSCLPSPGPPTRQQQQQHLLLHSPAATVGAAPHPGLAPEPAWQVCREGTEMLRGWARHWVQMGNSNDPGIPSILDNDVMVTVHFSVVWVKVCWDLQLSRGNCSQNNPRFIKRMLASILPH